nr:RNA-directed DNA polymerase [uncultured Shinella sp.]
MESRFHLINAGLFPETLPPCFTSNNAKRSFSGLVKHLDENRFHERKTEFVRYNGTKHDGSRRFFGTPNIVTYFHVSSFIWRNWRSFEENFELSNFSIGLPKLMGSGEERSLKVPSLSELSKHTSKNLKYAPFILKADIAQCFPSLYTHSISWAAHGVDQSKRDTDRASATNNFNALDFFVRNGQRGNTRGVLIGPDAYRLIAEFVLARIDKDLQDSVGSLIVGAARHVDDYYIGLRTEHDAQSVLSKLRDVLAGYELYLNDNKTKIYSSLEPINDLWAQRLRDHMGYLNHGVNRIERAVSEAVTTADTIGSDSPIKILFRSFDESRIYESSHWDFAEENLQRIVLKHPHSLDYACLLVAKRYAIGQKIDGPGWQAVAEIVIKRSLALTHDHEAIWMVWLLIVCKIEISVPMIEELSRSRNGHLRAMLVEAYVRRKITRRPNLSLGAGLSTTDSSWLTNLVARATGFSRAGFSGLYAAEFSHLADRRIRLIDFDSHSKAIKRTFKRAISRTRYGYDDDEDMSYPWENDDD